MYYTVYKITNQVNGKIYIGVHKTKDLDDSYMGSGSMLKLAFAKYGIENFKREHIAVFDNADEMFTLESELVNEEFVKSPNSYNMAIGGHGGWFNRSTYESLSRGGRNKMTALHEKAKHDVEIAAKIKTMAINGGKATANRLKTDLEFSKIHAERAAKTWTNRKHLDISKIKIGAANSVHMKGSGNSQFGSMWITDLASNKKISKDAHIPEGWMKGRKMFRNGLK